MTRCAGDCTHSFLSISYDADGNRLTLDVDGTLTPYSYTSGSNRLAAVGTDPVPTDVEGRITETAEYRYAWSQASRLDTVYRKVGPIEVEEARYGYDAFGLRRTKTTATGTTVYHYSEEGLLLAETTEDGQAVRTYVWAGSTPIAQVAELVVPPAVPGLPPTSVPQLTYLHVDHLDTPRWGTDEAGDLVWRWPSDGFGQAPPDQDPDGDGIPVTVNLRFPGQYHDAESGLAYNRFRYYDPGTGRYVSADPIGQAGGVNLYTYAGNDPVSWFDPLGLAACYVHFPDYPITYSPGRTSTWLGGHAGVLGYDESGSTRYYEYGRYSPAGAGIVGVGLPAVQGNVRRVTIPDLQIGPDGAPTPESWQNLLDALSELAGKGTDAELTCDSGADEDATYDYVTGTANDADRAPYSWAPWSANQCRTFASDAYEAGR